MEEAELTVWQQAMKDVLRVLDGHQAVAQALGYPDRRNVWPWTGLGRALPPEKAPALEKATGLKGEIVSVERLCPAASWVRVPDPAWPHPEGRPCLDVAPVTQQPQVA